MFRVLSIVAIILCLIADFIYAGSMVHGADDKKRSPGIRINRKTIPKTHAHGIGRMSNRSIAIVGKATSNEPIREPSNDTLVNFPCTCAVFLSGQFVRGSPKPPTGYPPIFAELEDQFSCDPVGVRRCVTRCLESMVKYIPKSMEIVCASIDRDCIKERAYLFVKNCRSGWVNTNMAAGREICCKNNEFYKCPNV